MKNFAPLVFKQQVRWFGTQEDLGSFGRGGFWIVSVFIQTARHYWSAIIRRWACDSRVACMDVKELLGIWMQT